MFGEEVHRDSALLASIAVGMLLASSCVCARSDLPVTGTKQRVASVEVTLLGGIFGDDITSTFDTCSELREVTSILEKHGFFGLRHSYINDQVHDGYADVIRVQFSDGTVFEVLDQNYSEPHFVAIMRELQSEGYDLPRRW
jgi:hypothetical protein